MHRLYAPFIGGPAGFGLLIFRIVTGIALMVHGWSKIQHPFTWMDKMGSGVPAFFQACAALSEFGGGLALVLGLLTPIACLGIAITMLGAIFMAHVPQGGAWIGGAHAFESAASYLVASVMLMLTGPGNISLDRKLFSAPKATAQVHVTPPKESVGIGV